MLTFRTAADQKFQSSILALLT